ncbi:MAG: hypothetical protein RIQ33_22 [Bacteroidota bacterium]|jgi:uncharacterized protein YxeA
MKKIVFSMFAIVFAAMMFAACTKNPAKVLPRKDGIWSYTATSTDASGTTTSSGKMTFTETAVTLTDASLSGVNFSGTWSYDKSGKKVTVTFSGSSSIYAVSDYTRKKETWTLSENGTTDVIKLTKD